MIFEFSSWSLLGPILDQFWLHFGSQNPTKSAPRGLQSRSKKWSKNLLSLDRFLNDFLSFLGQNGGTLSRRSNLKNLKNPSLGLKMWSKPSWDRFWTNFGSILAPKIRGNRPQEGSKVDQKSDRKTWCLAEWHNACKHYDWLNDPSIKFHEIKMRHGGGLCAQRTG